MKHTRTFNLFERFILNKWFWVSFFLLAFGLPLYRSMNRSLPPPLPIYSQLPDYQLTNERGQPFGAVDLKGRIYLANFIFTRCPTKCPALMKKVQIIQKRIRGLGQEVAIVTFTVDPAYDRPPQLFKYARDLRANPHIWTFLTGPPERIEKLLFEGLKVPVGRPRGGQSDQGDIDIIDLAHSEKIVLVDRRGRVRGYYNADRKDIDRLMIDVGLLANNSFSKGKS